MTNVQIRQVILLMVRMGLFPRGISITDAKFSRYSINHGSTVTG